MGNFIIILKEISAFLESVPLGPARVKSGLIFRESKFISAILFSSESWHSVKGDDIQRLEQLDQALLRTILFKSNPKIPIPFLYLETGTMKIRFHIISRRISYLQDILRRGDKDLVKKIFLAQKENITKGDFYPQVIEDMKFLDITLAEDEIIQMDKVKLKKLVKTKCLNACKNDLFVEQQTLSKIKNIELAYKGLEPYLSSPLFNYSERKLLSLLRSRVVPTMKSNFKTAFSDVFSLGMWPGAL